MADINVLTQRRNSLNQRIGAVNIELRKFLLQRSQGIDVDRAQAELDRLSQELGQLRRELDQVNAEINAAQQLATLPRQSTGQTVREDQAANADRADTQRPEVAPVVAGDNGRVSQPVRATDSNAQRPVTQQDVQGRDTGTDAQTRSATNLMGLPQVVASPGPLQPSSGGPRPGQNPGVAAANDNQTNATRAEINALFGGSQARIVTQPNVLDKYASYSYNIAIYIMSPADYARLIRTKQRILNGFQLLMQSGGAPLSSGFQPQATGGDTGEVPGVTTQSLLTQGRNQYFPLDYYIDDLQVRSLINGKATRGAHNVVSLDFKLIEPNGITFIRNLRRATADYIGTQQGSLPNQNYAAQHFLMVIRFYSYDNLGNATAVVGEVTDNQGNPLGRSQVVEKYIPFRFRNIKFRIASNLVEYQCEAVVPQVDINAGARGFIPYNMEIQARTLQELFVGNKVTGGTFQSAGAVTRQTNEFNPNGVENPSPFQVLAP